MKPSIWTIAALAFAGMSWLGLTTARAADAHTSYFMVASNPTDWWRATPPTVEKPTS